MISEETLLASNPTKSFGSLVDLPADFNKYLASSLSSFRSSFVIALDL